MNPLKCQALETYQKPPTKKLSLPLDFPVVPNPTYEDSNVSKIVCTARNASIPSEFKINNDFPSPDWKTIPSWSGSHALLSKADVKLKVVGYLPVFPYPITKHESVYSLLINLNSIAISLEQDVLPFVCDEGVYQYVVDIYLDKLELFVNLFPMLGGFHMAKAGCRCAGKYLRGLGIEDAMIEPAVFGPKTSEAVLDGSHYYRSLLGLMMIEDSGKRLKWEAFWKTHDPDNYKGEIETLSNLQQNLSDMNPAKSKACLDDIQKKRTLTRLLNDFDAFSEECTHKSEMCLYWENFFKIMETIKNLVKSEREGDFLLYEKTVGRDVPPFYWR